jgi:hypothetical protein
MLGTDTCLLGIRNCKQVDSPTLAFCCTYTLVMMILGHYCSSLVTRHSLVTSQSQNVWCEHNAVYDGCQSHVCFIVMIHAGPCTWTGTRSFDPFPGQDSSCMSARPCGRAQPHASRCIATEMFFMDMCLLMPCPTLHQSWQCRLSLQCPPVCHVGHGLFFNVVFMFMDMDIFNVVQASEQMRLHALRVEDQLLSSNRISAVMVSWAFIPSSDYYPAQDYRL